MSNIQVTSDYGSKQLEKLGPLKKEVKALLARGEEPAGIAKTLGINRILVDVMATSLAK